MPVGLNPPDIDNNTIYLSAGRTTPIFAACGVSNTDAPTINGLAYIYDNIFYVLGTTSYPLFNGTIFDFNTYYAPAYSADRPLNEPCSPGTNICDLVDNHKLTSDPQFVNAGPVRRGMAGVNGLKLKAGSDALASGYNSGYLGPHDYWGNAISTTTAPNRGAYDGPGLP